MGVQHCAVIPLSPHLSQLQAEQGKLFRSQRKHGVDGTPAMVRVLGILLSHPSASSLYTVILTGMKFKTEEEAVYLSFTDCSFHD